MFSWTFILDRYYMLRFTIYFLNLGWYIFLFVHNKVLITVTFFFFFFFLERVCCTTHENPILRFYVGQIKSSKNEIYFLHILKDVYKNIFEGVTKSYISVKSMLSAHFINVVWIGMAWKRDLVSKATYRVYHGAFKHL